MSGWLRSKSASKQEKIHKQQEIQEASILHLRQLLASPEGDVAAKQLVQGAQAHPRHHTGSNTTHTAIALSPQAASQPPGPLVCCRRRAQKCRRDGVRRVSPPLADSKELGRAAHPHLHPEACSLASADNAQWLRGRGQQLVGSRCCLTSSHKAVHQTIMGLVCRPYHPQQPLC